MAILVGGRIGYQVRGSGDADEPDEWQVIATGSDGTVFVTVFSGPNAREHADAYCDWQTSANLPRHGGRLAKGRNPNQVASVE